MTRHISDRAKTWLMVTAGFAAGVVIDGQWLALVPVGVFAGIVALLDVLHIGGDHGKTGQD